MREPGHEVNRDSHPHDWRDVEAETAHRIRMLVARAGVWMSPKREAKSAPKPAGL